MMSIRDASSPRGSRPPRVMDLFWPCASMIAMACVVGLLTISPASGRTLLTNVVVFLLTGALSAAVALAVLVAWQLTRRGLPPRPAIRLVTAMLMASACLVGVLARPGWWGSVVIAYLAISSILTMGCVFLWRFADDVLQDWRVARHTQLELSASLEQTDRVNGLLVDVTREWFDIYGIVVEQQVARPLRDLRTHLAGLDTAAVADRIDHLVDGIMRPLAHGLHPVAASAGIISSVQQMAPGLTAVADAEIRGLDSTGLLLDDHVRLQVHRWVRGLRPAGVDATLTITRDTESVCFILSDFGSAPPLDAVQQLAGLTIDEAGVLRAPRHGEEPARPSAVAPRHVARTSPLRLLGTSPVVSLRLVAIIAVAAIPAQLYGTNVTLTIQGLMGSLWGVLITVAVACLVAATPWSRRGTEGPWWPVAAWCVIGVVSGVCSLLVARVVGPSGITAAASLSIVGRGIVRFALVGLLHQLARGYAAQASRDAHNTARQLDHARRIRLSLLRDADATDRFVAETLHRTIQGRLSAISLLLRLGRRDEAVRELEALCDVTLPAIEGELADLAPGQGRDVAALAPEWLGMRLIDRVDWAEVRDLSPRLETDLRRVIDECLVNARRHGAATAMEVQLLPRGDELILQCTDNGRGDVAAGSSGLGSQIFSEACATYGGTWHLRSEESGAELTLTIRLSHLGGHRPALPGRN